MVYISTMKTEAILFSETSVDFYRITRLYIQGGHIYSIAQSFILKLKYFSLDQLIIFIKILQIHEVKQLISNTVKFIFAGFLHILLFDPEDIRDNFPRNVL